MNGTELRSFSHFQIFYQNSIPGLFLMDRTELRSFCHFQILTKIAFLDLTGNLEN